MSPEPKPEPPSDATPAEPAAESPPADVGPRPFWSGTISFGLVAVPIEVYPALRSPVGRSLRMLAPDGSPVEREYLCPAEDRPVTRDELVRALEPGKLDPPPGMARPSGDEPIVLTDDELEALAPAGSRELEIHHFIALDQLSPLLFERAYFLLPTGAIKPYRLLARVLEDQRRAGIATFVMRGREHLAAILSADGLLRIQTLRFASELRTPADLGLPPVPAELDAALVEQFAALLATLREAEPGDPIEKPSQAADDLAQELSDQRYAETLALARRKLAEGRDVVEAPPTTGDTDAEDSDSAEVIDLMTILARALALADGS
jgi:DNA end-binding protein Ku